MDNNNFLVTLGEIQPKVKTLSNETRYNEKLYIT